MVMSDATLRPGSARFDDIDVVIDESTWGKHEAVVAVMPGRWMCPLAFGATPPPSFCDLFNAGERLARLNVVRFRMWHLMPEHVGWPSPAADALRRSAAPAGGLDDALYQTT